MAKKERLISNHLFKGMLMLVCLALMSLPISAYADKPGGGGGTSTTCINLSISLSPSTISPGGGVGVFAMVTNCSSSKVRWNDVFTSMSPCGLETTLASGRLVLNPGQTMQVTVSYPIPPDACPGLYTVTVTVAGASASTTLTVL